MRWHCVCCALPRRVLEHVARQTGGDHAVRLGLQHELSQHIRSQRHGRAKDHPRPPEGAGRRLVYGAGGLLALPGQLVRAEGAAAARDKAANQAYKNLGVTLDFYRKVFGRESLDGGGMDVLASVHFGDRFSNAMWNGEQMLFGDGDGQSIGGFTKSLDIVAHELTHAVTQHTVGALGVVRKAGRIDLVGESGALNESISDVFASLVTQWHKKQKAQDADWLVGKGILGPGLGKAVRSLKHPGRKKDTYPDDDQVAKIGIDYDPKDDVHRNSGIPNHAFCLAATGLRGYAWEHAGRIWYEALALLKKDSGFRDAAQATVNTARRLFGDSSKEQQAVREAWQKVGVLPG